MSEEYNFPKEINEKIMTLLKDVDGEYQITDLKAFAKLVAEYGEQYPSLYDFIEIDKEEIISHYKNTGEVPPGVKLVETSSEEGSNVINLRVLHGRKN